MTGRFRWRTVAKNLGCALLFLASMALLMIAMASLKVSA